MKVRIIRKPSATFGSEVGSGMGCLMGAIALGILFNFPAVLALLSRYLPK